MPQKNLNGFCCTATVFILVMSVSQVFAQSTPSELAGLTMQELVNLKIGQADIMDTRAENSRWHVAYYYRRAKFEGYRDGTNDLPTSVVLFDGNPANRTDKNFPVVPTKIIQQAHILNIAYQIDELSSVHFVVPYIVQTTDHISIVPGFAQFTISSQGIGDVVMSYTRRLWQNGKHTVLVNAGLSFPIGSINEEGDTPRAPGDQQLPFTMQIGSGTVDLPASINYSGYAGKWIWGGELSGKVRFGKNSRNYRLGNRAGLTSWLRVRVSNWLEPSVKLDYQYSEHIHGIDDELLVPAAFPFPAAITNPKFFGGHKLFAVVGVQLKPPIESLRQHTIYFSFSKPIYQSLNGIQVQEDHNFNISWKWNF